MAAILVQILSFFAIAPKLGTWGFSGSLIAILISVLQNQFSSQHNPELTTWTWAATRSFRFFLFFHFLFFFKFFIFFFYFFFFILFFSVRTQSTFQHETFQSNFFFLNAQRNIACLTIKFSAFLGYFCTAMSASSAIFKNTAGMCNNCAVLTAEVTFHFAFNDELRDGLPFFGRFETPIR